MAMDHLGAADAPDGAQTPLDAAWTAARAAQEAAASEAEVDAAAARFIDVLLSEPLICPIWEDDPDGIAPDAPFTPKLIELDGTETFTLFDREERMAEAITEPTAFVALPGRAFVALAAQRGAQIALNRGVAPSATLLAPEALEALTDLIRATEEAAEETELGGGFEVLSPGETPPALLNALAARLTVAKALIAEAWLFALEPVEDGAAAVEGALEERRLVLGLLPHANAPAETEGGMRALVRELSRLGGVVMTNWDGAAPLDVAVLERDDAVLAAARRRGFGLHREDAA